jgi:hypothetical protein
MEPRVLSRETIESPGLFWQCQAPIELMLRKCTRSHVSPQLEKCLLALLFYLLLPSLGAVIEVLRKQKKGYVSSSEA